MTTIALIGASIAALIGLMVLWANPLRRANRTLAILAGLGVCHLLFIYQAIKSGEAYIDASSPSPLPWLRSLAIVDTLFPFMTWLLRANIAEPRTPTKRLARKGLGWLLFASTLSVLALTEYYIPTTSTPVEQQRGPAYLIYGMALSTAFALIGIQATRDISRLSGISKVEMQFFVINVCICGVVSILLANIVTLLGAPYLRRITLVAFLASYILMSIAIAFHKIFNIRQVFISIFVHCMLVAILAGISVLVLHVTSSFLKPDTAHLVSVVVVVLAALYIGLKLQSQPQITGAPTAESLRLDLIRLARSESSTASLIGRFERLLCEQTACLSATLLFEHGETYTGRSLTIKKQDSTYETLMERGWATPESLERMRPTPQTQHLRNFLDRHNLAILVAAPRGSETPSMLLGLGVKVNDWPFTYPEMESLRNLAELMDNILTHSRLANQAALQSKMEHLAMMSRGLAHDLKNLITPVSSFLLHTEGQYQAGSPEAEVHGEARNSIRVMSDYVSEALFFSERLEPVFQDIDPGVLVEGVRKLIASRAAARGMTIQSVVTLDKVFAGDHVLLQRLLANLLGNAIDASDQRSAVELRVSSGLNSVVRFEVRDTGAGISPEDLPRIFEPYFTTKQYGSEVRGFGLGLTICQKIVNLHSGTIRVQSELGKGTTVTVELPIQAARHLLPAGPCLALP